MAMLIETVRELKKECNETIKRSENNMKTLEENSNELED